MEYLIFAQADGAAVIASIGSYLVSMGLPGIVILALGYLNISLRKELTALQAKRDLEVQALNDKVALTLEKTIPLVSEIPHSLDSLHAAIDRIDRLISNGSK